MNRQEFMGQLKNHLRKLPFDEVKEAVEYYEQYFDDAGEENEQAVIAELGSPSAVASQVIASFAVKGADAGKSAKRGFSSVWLIMLSIFASPIALPIALAVVVVAFALVLVLFSVLFSIGVTGAGLALGGVASMITGIVLVAQSFPTALFFFGLGMAIAGSGWALMIWTVRLSKTSFNALAKRMGKFILRRNAK